MKLFASLLILGSFLGIDAYAQSCRLHVPGQVTAQQMQQLNRKGFQVVPHADLDSKTSHSDFAAQFSEGDFGYKMSSTARGFEGFLYWSSNKDPYRGEVFAYRPAKYYTNVTFKDSNYENFHQVIPICSDLKKIEAKLHYGMLMRSNASRSKKALLNGWDTDFSWGRFFINAEATQSSGLNLEKRRRWINSRYSKYDEILALRESVHENATFLDKVQWVRDRLIKDHGLESNQGVTGFFFGCDDNGFISHLLKSKPCGNYIAKTLLVISALKDLGINPTRKYRIGVQHFTDYLRPVIYFTEEEKILDLITGEFDEKFSGIIYKPEFVFWGYERFLQESESIYQHWHLPSYDYRRRLIMEMYLWRAPINAYRDALDFLDFDTEKVYRWGTADWFFFSFNFGLGDGDSLGLPSGSSILPQQQSSAPSEDSEEEHPPEGEDSEAQDEDGTEEEEAFDAEEAMDSKGWEVKNLTDGRRLTWEEMQEYFKDEALNTVARVSRISQLKNHLQLAEVNQGITTGYGISIKCISDEEVYGVKTMQAELTDDAEVLNLIFLEVKLPDSPQCQEDAAKDNHAQYLALLETYDSVLQQELKKTEHLDQFLDYLRTGRVQHLSQIDDLSHFDSNTNIDFAVTLQRSLQVFPRHPSIKPEFPIKNAFEQRFTRYGFMSKELAEKLLPALHRHLMQHSDHKNFILKLSSLSDSEMANFFSVMAKLQRLLREYERSIIIEAETADMKNFIQTYLPSYPVRSEEAVKTLFRPLRKLLINLLNDQQAIYVPYLSEREMEKLNQTLSELEQIKQEEEEQKKKEQEQQADNGLVVPPSPLDTQFEVRTIEVYNIPLQSTLSSKPIWEREIEEIDPSILQGLFGVQHYEDRRSGDFVFPMLLRWGDALVEDYMEVSKFGYFSMTELWKVHYSYLTYKPSSSSDRLTVRKNYQRGSYPTFRRGVIGYEHIIESYQFYMVSPSAQYLDFTNSVPLRNERRTLYAMFSRFQKFPQILAEKVIEECSEVQAMVFGGNGNCQLSSRQINSLEDFVFTDTSGELDSSQENKLKFKKWLELQYEKPDHYLPRMEYLYSNYFNQGNKALRFDLNPLAQ